jgi:hypothetical protein
VKQLQEILAGTKIEVLGVVDSKGPPRESELKQVLELADKVEAKLSEF